MTLGAGGNGNGDGIGSCGQQQQQRDFTADDFPALSNLRRLGRWIWEVLRRTQFSRRPRIHNTTSGSMTAVTILSLRRESQTRESATHLILKRRQLIPGNNREGEGKKTHREGWEHPSSYPEPRRVQPEQGHLLHDGSTSEGGKDNAEQLTSSYRGRGPKVKLSSHPVAEGEAEDMKHGARVLREQEMQGGSQREEPESEVPSCCVGRS